MKTRIAKALAANPDDLSSALDGLRFEDFKELAKALTLHAEQAILVAAYVRRRAQGAYSHHEAMRYARRIVQIARRNSVNVI